MKQRVMLPMLLVLALPMACTTTTPEPKPSPPPPEIIPPPPPTVSLGNKSHYAMCNGQVRDMADVLRPIVSALEAQKIPYNRSAPQEWRDCSGNFLRLSSAVAAACPDAESELTAPAGVRPYVKGGNNVVQFNVPYRSSRAVAKWYADRGRLTPIYYDDAPSVADVPQDLLDHRNLIRPGAVVWFSRGRPVSTLGLEQLFAAPSTPNNINHMATVTEVTRDPNGNVIQYKMYHGHGKEAKGTPASVTTKQYFEFPASMSRSGPYPPLGYWSQRIVAVGTLLPPVTSAPVP